MENTKPLRYSTFTHIPVHFSKIHSPPRPPSKRQQQVPAHSPNRPGALHPQLLLFQPWPFTRINIHSCQHWHKIPFLFVGSLLSWIPQGPNPFFVHQAQGGVQQFAVSPWVSRNSQLTQSRRLAHRSRDDWPNFTCWFACVSFSFNLLHCRQEEAFQCFNLSKQYFQKDCWVKIMLKW